MDLNSLVMQFGWVIFPLMVWSMAWKAVALWKSARNKHLVWFIVFMVVNTLGILEILYIYIFANSSKKIRNK